MTLDEFDVTDLLPPRLSVDHISLWERLRNDPVLALVAFVVISSVLSISTFLYTLAGMFFLNYGTITDAPLFFAAKEGDSVAVAALLREDMDPETPGVYRGWNRYGIGAFLKAETPLSWACGGGHLDVVDLLVKAGANVHNGSQLGPFGSVSKASPLFAASHGGHAKVVRYLLEKGANPNLGWRIGPFGLVARISPISRASENGNSDVIDILAEAGAKGAEAFKNKGG